MENEKLKQYIERFHQFRDRLDEMMGTYRHGRQLRLVMSCAFWAMVSFFVALLLFLLAERTPLQSEVIRYISSAVFYLLMLWWLKKAVTAVITPPPPTALAVEIENASQDFTSGLSSAVEFNQKTAAANDSGTSELMRRLTIAAASEKLSADDIVKALKAFSRKQSAMAMLIFMVLAMIWFAISPIEVSTGAARMVFPLRAIAPFSTLSLEILPGNAVLALGDSIEIAAVPSRKVTDPIILQLFENGENEGSKVEMYPDATASVTRFVYTLNSLQNSLSYQVSSEKSVSEKYSIQVVPRPQVKKLQLTLFQPSYVATGPITLSDGTGDAEVLIGSKVRMDITADQNLASAAIVFSDGRVEDCSIVKENSFSYEITLATDTVYHLMLQNELGLINEKPVSYNLKALVDRAPIVELLKPAQDIPFPTSKRLDVKAVARDDFGVKTMILYYRVGERSSLIPQNLKPDFRVRQEYEVDFPWMLDTLPLQPGTKISYFVQAEDACQPVVNVATSPTYFINMPSMYDMYRGEEASQNKVNQQLEEFIENQKLRKEALMKAFEQIKHEEKLDFEASQAIEKAIEQGEQSQKQAKEILENLQKLQENMENNPLSSPDALERMQKVSELLNEVLDEETRKMMQQLRESLQELKMDPKELEKYEQAFKMEDYLKSLDRTIDLLNQVKEQQKLSSLAQAIEDLHRRQEHIASETAALNEKMKNEGLSSEEESQLKDLADQQDKIASELEQLQKQSEEMTQNRKSEEFKQNPLLEDVKNIRDRLQKEEFKKQNDEIKKDMDQKNLDSAQQKQEQMLQFLEALKKDSEQISQMCSGGQAKQLDLSMFIRRALRVSHDQEMLFKEIQYLPAQFMRGQRPEIEGLIDQVSVLQVLVRQQGNDLENDLEKFVRSSFSVDPSSVEAIKGTQNLFAAIVKNLEDRAMSAASEDQQEIVRRFNKLVIELMRAQDQSGGSGSPNPMDALQQFKDLTRRQLSLYQQMMQRQMAPQNSQTLEAMKRMAMEQKQIREALEKLMRESREQMNSLGRLDDVIEDMNDLETKILDPSMRRKVAEKQKSIYERMLKAQKAIKNRDEESEERKADKAREIIQQQPDQPIGEIGSDSRDLSKDFLGDLKEEFPSAYRPMLNDYFRSLNIYGGEK